MYENMNIYTTVCSILNILWRIFWISKVYKSIETVKKSKMQNTEEGMFDIVEFLYWTIFENIRYHIDYKTNKIIST